MAESKGKGKGGSNPFKPTTGNPHPVTVQVSPPAYAVRQQAGLQMPNLTQMGQAVIGPVVGAGVAAGIISFLPPERRIFGAVGGLLIGGIAAATSPIGTIPQEMGIGALSLSVGWFWWEVAGAFGAAQSGPGTAGLSESRQSYFKPGVA